MTGKLNYFGKYGALFSDREVNGNYLRRLNIILNKTKLYFAVST